MSFKTAMDGTDEISDGLASLQLKEKLISQKEKLLEEMRQVMSMASDIIEGFSPPYVRMSSRKLLKRFLEILVKYRNFFQSVGISISDEIMSEAESLHFEMINFSQSSTHRISRITRSKINQLMEDMKKLLSNVVANGTETKILSAKRIDMLSEIINEIMPETVKYSVEYLPNKTVIVYIDDHDLVESIGNEIAESLKKYNLSDKVDVVPATDGLIFTDPRIECNPFLVSGAPVKQYIRSEDGEQIPAGTVEAIVSLLDDDGAFQGLGALTADHVCSISGECYQKAGISAYELTGAGYCRYFS